MMYIYYVVWRRIEKESFSFFLIHRVDVEFFGFFTVFFLFDHVDMRYNS